MPKTPVVLDLSIPNKAENIAVCVQEVIAVIRSHVDLDLGYERRIKMILIELITNSIKHSSEPMVHLKLTIDQPQLSIKKIEKGLKIEFSASSPQIPFKEIDEELNISFSDANSYRIKPLNRYEFEFLKPAEETPPDMDNMPEHFGLYIITMASDSFTYQFNPDDSENHFLVTLKL